jgi:1-acyl-sn-glycerol-3-phosphate acyltransferase
MTPAQASRPASAPDSDDRRPRLGVLVRVARVLAAAYFRLAHGVAIRGREHLPERGPAVLAPNHQSHYDGVVAGFSLRCPVYWMVAGKYYDLPILGGLLRAFRAFPVYGPHDRGCYARTLELLRAGEVVAIFPEGHRSPDGRVHRLRSGAARAALTVGTDVVPVTIVGAYDAWPRRRALPRLFRPIVVEYHPAVPCPRVADHGELRSAIEGVNRRLERIFRRRVGAWRRLRRRKG